jgi:SAM-dependent methyltransferase
MSGTARIRCWPVPGGGWPGSTRATRGITTSTSTAGSCATCQPAAVPPWISAAGRACSPGSWPPHFARVTAIDADAGVAAAASARLAQDPKVTIRHCGFGQFAAAPSDGEADLITMVAVLHYLCLDETLARIPRLLAPGGRLLVVGLARVNSLPDLAADLISAANAPGSGPAVLLPHSTDSRKTLRPKPPRRLRLSSASARSCGQGMPAVMVRAGSTSSTPASLPGRSSAVALAASWASLLRAWPAAPRGSSPCLVRGLPDGGLQPG